MAVLRIASATLPLRAALLIDSKEAQVIVPARTSPRVEAISLPLEGLTKDISLHGCGIRFDEPVPQIAGRLSLYLQDLGSTEVREVRRTSGQEVFFEMLNVPPATENALFAKLFLDPANHKKQLSGARSLYAGCVKRFFGKLD